MSGAIYLLQYNGQLLSQRLLADYPDLLAGDQMGAHTARRWLLVRREIPVPGDEQGRDGGRSITCSWTRTEFRRS